MCVNFGTSGKLVNATTAFVGKEDTKHRAQSTRVEMKDPNS